MRTVSLPRAMLALALLLLLAVPCTGQTQTLERRMEAFLATMRRRSDDSTVHFFPRTGTFTYVRTSHIRGREGVRPWVFPADQALRAMDYGGPLYHSFSINPHAQPIALLYQQVILREGRWRRVRGNRFVPPGAPASSPTFVEWRREDGEWVVSAFGDELFGRPFPDWCC